MADKPVSDTFDEHVPWFADHPAHAGAAELLPTGLITSHRPVACLLEHGQGHVGDDVRGARHKGLPFLLAYVAISRQICLRQCLASTQTSKPLLSQQGCGTSLRLQLRLRVLTGAAPAPTAVDSHAQMHPRGDSVS